MWAATMPYYSEYQTGRRKGMEMKTGPAPQISPVLDDTSSGRLSTMLEPAIDGPPSPERLRQISKEAKRASHLKRNPGHRTTSSGSSSMRSANNAERPAWELTLENMSLGRKPSARSTSSSTASRDRESTQSTGMGLFQRINRHNRESKSSSGSSLYSADTSTNDSFVAGAKETLSIPTLFSRRKPAKEDNPAVAAQRRLQISGPFNFEHVASTRREHVASISNASTPGPTSAPVMGLEPHHPRAGFPSPETPSTHQFGPLTAPLQRPSLVGRHTSPAPGPRRLVKHARSQEHLRASPPHAPPRPPRSPREPVSPPPMPPVPPPRVSSQAFDNFPGSFDRPLTSGGFRRPQPFSSPKLNEDSPPLPATSHGYVVAADLDAFECDSNRFSHAITTPNDAAWPLGSSDGSTPTYETALADVPEEEESHVRRSRLSMASNNSSLRGSHSVPMLRSLAQSQRPMSGASDTLGRFHNLGEAATNHGRAAANHNEATGPNDNWEDCIDYCYEHEADANFDYQWDRNSMDEDRGALSMAVADEDLAEARTTPTSTPLTPMSAGNITQFLDDSPESRVSTILPNDESFVRSTTPSTNNFSLPLKDRAAHLAPLQLRPMSCASSFKESHGFNLSPSLLIPGDYHQEMLLSTGDRESLGFDQEVPALPYRNPEESRFDSTLTFQQRSSTSTTESASTAQSDSTSGRHNSSNSSWTASTRLTSSTTSLTKLASSVAKAEEQTNAEAEQQADMDADAVPELIPFPSASGGRKSFHRSHASESITREETPASKSAEAQKTRRGRARTTSLSSQAPPVGQYALFPRTYAKGSGERI